jgi:hypothetical protein
LTPHRTTNKVVVNGKKTSHNRWPHPHLHRFLRQEQQPLTSPAGELTQATYIFTTIILGLIRDQKPDVVAEL